MPTETPHHRLAVQGRQGQLVLAVDVSLSAPWTLLFGASGSGKSTILRAIAGLTPKLQVNFARHEHSTQSWTTLESADSFTPVHNRGLAYAPQSASLLPHLNVEQNIRFPETLRRTPAGKFLTPEIIALLDLQNLVTKRPQQLSGGERQRVSLARALAVPNAHLLLLDEPFAGLDRAMRDDLLPRLRAHLTARKLPVLSVTHDPDEALLVQADVLRINNGKLIAQGPPEVVLADEIARLANILPSTRSR